VEKGNGKNGSMEKFGSKELNISTLKNNLKYFNCDHNTIVIPTKIKEAATQISNYGPLSLIVIDADGAIDRDFVLFYNLLKPGSYIIIDDYENSKTLTPNSKNNPLGKKYTTYLFVNYFLNEGLIEQKELIGNTIFCRKPKKITGSITFNEGQLNLIRTNINLEAQKITKISY